MPLLAHRSACGPLAVRRWNQRDWALVAAESVAMLLLLVTSLRQSSPIRITRECRYTTHNFWPRGRLLKRLRNAPMLLLLVLVASVDIAQMYLRYSNSLQSQ